MRYVGGKNKAGMSETLVSLMPRHTIYIEAFCGSGAVLRLKKPSLQSIAIDKDGGALALVDRAVPNLTLVKGDALPWLENRRWKGCELVYLDPPYLPSTRKWRNYYKHEMGESEHRQLLDVIKRIPAMVMISGYASELYDTALAGWERTTFKAYARSGQPRTEIVWMNFKQQDELHDVRFVGLNFRQRWRIKKRIRRWSAKLVKMSPHERSALFAALVDVMEQQGDGLLELAAPDLARLPAK